MSTLYFHSHTLLTCHFTFRNQNHWIHILVTDSVWRKWRCVVVQDKTAGYVWILIQYLLQSQRHFFFNSGEQSDNRASLIYSEIFKISCQILMLETLLHIRPWFLMEGSPFLNCLIANQSVILASNETERKEVCILHKWV